MSELGYRAKCLQQKINACAVCGDSDELVVHHINGDRDNNALENLVPMCKPCHQTIHVGTDDARKYEQYRDQLPESAVRERERVEGEITTIQVTDEIWRELHLRKTPGDSFDDVISRLLAEEIDND